jgi:serine/threonine protein kinase
VSGAGPVLPELGRSGTVAGYQLQECIGQSDVAVVRLAWDEYRDRTVAVKILAPELAGDTAFRARFLSDSRAAAAIRHPHIVPIYAAGEAGGTVYVAMRHVGGGDARSLLSRPGPLPLARAWSVIAQVASALDAAHGRGLIHRDVKPANMLLDAHGAADGRAPDRADGYGDVYLSDFGMGRDVSPGELMAAGQFAGVLDYLAPEQIQGRALDGRADLYALACAGFELLCGTSPFGQDQGLTVMYAQLYAPPPAATARRPDLPAEVDPVLATALAKNPADRYPTCGQFAEELRRALGLLPGGPDDPARLRPPGRARSVAARSVAEARSASSQERPAGRHQPGPEPARTPAAVRPEPARPPSEEDQPPAGPGHVNPDPVSAPGRPSRPLRHRSAVITLILALAAAGITAAVTIAAVAARPAQGRPTASSPAATSARPSPSPSPSAPAPSSSAPSASTLASRQAAAVNTLLGSSAATRRALQGAVSEARDCTDLTGAVSQIQDSVDQRSAEYSQASALSISGLPDGTIVKTDLTAALRSSLQADRDYLAWARQLELGCVPATQSSAYDAANAADEQANAAKEAFVQVWNPVAARYGIQQESPASI